MGADPRVLYSAGLVLHRVAADWLKRSCPRLKIKTISHLRHLEFRPLFELFFQQTDEAS
jgi:hypothetical protein